MIIKQLIVSGAFLALSASAAQALQQEHADSTTSARDKSMHHVQPKHEDDGAQIFQQNCSRCHNSPEGFSPRISGTVVQHMRVRASLSKEDQEKLLRFFNP